MNQFIKPETLKILGGIPEGMDPIVMDWVHGDATLIEWMYKAQHYSVGGHVINRDMRELVLQIAEDIRDGVPKCKDMKLDELIDNPRFTFDKVTLKGNFPSSKR